MATSNGKSASSRSTQFAEINARNAEFYGGLWSDTGRRMKDPGLRQSAYDELKRESIGLPPYFQKPIEFLLAEAERKRAFFMGLNGRNGGKRRDSLQVLIERIVKSRPDTDSNSLLHRLRDETGNGTVHDIADGKLTFTIAKGTLRSAKISALKHRLSRAKKEIVAKSR